MDLKQNGQSFDFTTEDGRTMSLVRRAGIPAAEFIRYARLFAASDELLAELINAQADVCSLYCPSVWKTGEPQPHSDRCVAISAVIQEAGGA